MKQKLLLLTLLISSASFGQSILPVNANVIMPAKSIGLSDHSNGLKSTVCGYDTVQYTFAKTTGLATIALNNTTSAQSVSQYFDAPQSLTISGAQFYAYKDDITGGISRNVNLQIYAAGPDSMPSGAILASAIVPVDTSFGGGSLDVLKKIGTFAPITIDFPYVVVINNSSAFGITFVVNSYTAGDGGLEWLASANLFGTWTRSYSITVGGVPLDGDILIDPFVQTTLVAGYTIDDACFDLGLDLVFTNTSSPVNSNRMYNVAAYMGAEEDSYTWNYGDASAEENLIDGMHTFAASGAYDVMLTDTLYGWTNTCVSDITITLGEGPTVDWASSSTDLIATFTDMSTSNGVTTYLWDLGDGNTSTVQNPTHTYATAGTYTVCLTATNPCGSDSTCNTVTVTAAIGVGLNELSHNFMEVSPNPSNDSFIVNANATMTSVQLIDLSGKEVYRNELNSLVSKINVAEIANGQYLIKVKFEDGTTTNTRIQVQH